MDDIYYKPNSHKFKEEQKAASEERKKVEKVVTGVAKVKKKNKFGKLAGELISEDTSNVKSYLVQDVLIPAIKNTIEDIVTKGIRMFLRGDASGSRRDSQGSRISYGKFYDRDSDRRSIDTRPKNRFDYDDIIVESRGEAEAILSQMDEIIATYKFVSVLDLYDMVGITAPYTADKYGWTDLRTARVVPVREGYVLKLPKAFPID